MLVLYSATLVVSAALVFMVQPMFARLLLPLLGGASAVWTVAILFFQSTLLAAYVYVHWATRRFGARRQAALHLALVAAALLLLPIGVPDGWAPPVESSPLPWLLAVLVVGVGLPFFVVSSTAPLLQSWLAATDHPDAADPYFLYRASNLGSVIGLLAYPVVVEPGLTLDAQTWMWAAGYGLMAALLTGCAAALWRSRGMAAAPPREAAAVEEEVARSRKLRWVALAFVPSSLMMGATTTLSLSVAPMPFLWVLPLALYLVSFVVVFSRARGRAVAHRVAVLAMAPLVVLVAGAVAMNLQQPLWAVVLIHLVALFVVALVCHGELAADRPSAANLTGFYVLVSVGGALGGVFNGVVAPLAFDSLLEYPLTLILACLLLPGATRWTDQVSVPRHLLPPLLVGAAAYVAVDAFQATPTGRWAAAGVAGLACVLLSRHPVRFALALAALMVAIWATSIGESKVIHRDRSFFGMHRVAASPDYNLHELQNGTTVHGGQVGALALDPVAYYSRQGPMGQLLEALPDRSLVERTGVVGLGAGTMACHARRGERWKFFEIDPAVARIARDPQLFSYLEDCLGTYDIVLGDGRLSLAKERDGAFGLLVMDAFGGDAVPVHLLTTDAVELYERKLQPGGVLGFHLSNAYLELEPVVGNVAHANGLACFAQAHAVDPAVTRRTYAFSSLWAAIARDPRDLGRIPHDPRWRPCLRDDGARPWSDDYSNVLGAVRWKP